ncbi:MAG TPA: hypothetical protein VMM38_00010 [Aridibacter sp.]|nr:hypothetical protein [Aridibacter sp.]
MQLAQVYVGLGDIDRALEWLETAFDDNSVWLIWLGVHPAFGPLRSDPRLMELTRQNGLVG